MSAPNFSDTLDSHEAAIFLGVKEQVLNKLRRNGKVKGIQVGNARMYRYTISALREADLSNVGKSGRPKKE